MAQADADAAAIFAEQIDAARRARQDRIPSMRRLLKRLSSTTCATQLELAVYIGLKPATLSEFMTGQRHKKKILEQELLRQHHIIAAALQRRGLPSSEAEAQRASAAGAGAAAVPQSSSAPMPPVAESPVAAPATQPCARGTFAAECGLPCTETEPCALGADAGVAARSKSPAAAASTGHLCSGAAGRSRGGAACRATAAEELRGAGGCVARVFWSGGGPLGRPRQRSHTRMRSLGSRCQNRPDFRFEPCLPPHTAARAATARAVAPSSKAPPPPRRIWSWAGP